MTKGITSYGHLSNSKPFGERMPEATLLEEIEVFNQVSQIYKFEDSYVVNLKTKYNDYEYFIFDQKPTSKDVEKAIDSLKKRLLEQLEL